MTKHEIREIYLQKRLQLSESECENFSQQICAQFFSATDLSQIKVVHTFLPIKKNNEPNTWLIVDRLKKDFPSITISIPRVVEQNLVNYLLDTDCILQENKWGTQEPNKGNLIDPKEIDLVIVPLLSFDLKGNRIGYGKGYYDRFLVTCRNNCQRVGISFFSPINLIEDVDEHDIPLTACIYL